MGDAFTRDNTSTVINVNIKSLTHIIILNVLRV